MKETLPINGNVLSWARESIGLDVDKLASKMNVSPDEIREWESGNSGPTYSQLERLANQHLKRPIAVFFFPSVPQEDGIKTDFRTLPGTLLDSLPARIISLYRKAKSLQFSLEELLESESSNGIRLIPSTASTETLSISELAADVRRRLGVTTNQQFEWKTTDTAFKEWRVALESAGVFVFKDAFRDDRYSGFCLSHSRYPLIYVNNSMPASRQIFTLFHEVYHLLTRAGGVDFSDEGIRASLTSVHAEIERRANKFANAFLVPQDRFDLEDQAATDANIARLANRYSVSREVILRNLLDRGIVSRGAYQDFIDDWAEQLDESPRSGGGSYYNNQIAYYGKRYLDLVFGRYYSGKITVEQLSQHLHMKVRSVEALESRVVSLA